jgi:uncharacterized membrane protein
LQQNDFLNPETEHQRKAAIYARHARTLDRRALQRRWRRVLTVPGLAIACIILLWLVSPYAPPALMHTYPVNCAQARAMGYGNVRIGTPGYFAHLDRDGDGISCEPWPPAWR